MLAVVGSRQKGDQKGFSSRKNALFYLDYFFLSFRRPLGHWQEEKGKKKSAAVAVVEETSRTKTRSFDLWLKLDRPPEHITSASTSCLNSSKQGWNESCKKTCQKSVLMRTNKARNKMRGQSEGGNGFFFVEKRGSNFCLSDSPSFPPR